MKPIPKEGPASDGAVCYEVGITALREIAIRRHNVLPRPGDVVEQMWWDEGPVPVRELDSATGRHL